MNERPLCPKCGLYMRLASATVDLDMVTGAMEKTAHWVCVDDNQNMIERDITDPSGLSSEKTGE